MKSDNRLMPGVRGVLFDLDGTLLQVEMKEFIPAYVRGLAEHFADLAPPHIFSKVVLGATRTLLRSEDGGRSNEEIFLEALGATLGIEGGLFNERLAHYCAGGLQELTSLVRSHSLARRILECCFERGLRVVIATNPVFPRSVVDARLEWGELLDLPFDLVTSYENSRYCKPDPRYFTDILDSIGLRADQCLMVGNDTVHDLAAHRIGMATFLLDTWLIDRGDGAFRCDFRGGHLDLFHLLSGGGAAGQELT